jgi:hypothetical protein
MEEIWKELDNFPLYEVSTFGNIRNKKTKMNLKLCTKRTGYEYVSLFDNNKKRKIHSVHRLIAKTFIPNIDNKPTVNHKDHNPKNNNINNLEWATYLEQVIHKRKPRPEIYEYTGTRPVWRICPETNNKLQQYSSIKNAARWVFDNKLTKVKEFGKGNNIKTKICSVIRKGKTNGKNTCKDKYYERKTAYGFNWEYENENENIFEDEVWKEISFDLVNFEGYFVSSYGRIRNNKGRITTGYSKQDDYLVVNINNKGYYIHRLVALVFIPNPNNKPIVNHIDGNKQNPKLNNLEWVDNSENSRHAVVIGKIRTKEIIQYDLNNNKINTFNSVKEASEYLKISKGTVSNICNKKFSPARNYTLEWKLNSS